MAWEVPMSDSVRSLTLYGVKRGESKGKDSLGVSGRFNMVGAGDAAEGGIPRGDGRGGDGRGVRKHPFERVSDLKFLVIELERKQPLGSHCFWFFLSIR